MQTRVTIGNDSENAADNEFVPFIGVLKLGCYLQIELESIRFILCYWWVGRDEKKNGTEGSFEIHEAWDNWSYRKVDYS